MYTVEIYMALLINILDSQMNFSVSGGVRKDYNGTPTPREEGVVYDNVRAAIIRIFEIVKLFQNDHAGFWSFLQHVGCITDNTDEKDSRSCHTHVRHSGMSFVFGFMVACVLIRREICHT